MNLRNSTLKKYIYSYVLYKSKNMRCTEYNSMSTGDSQSTDRKQLTNE